MIGTSSLNLTARKKGRAVLALITKRPSQKNFLNLQLQAPRSSCITSRNWVMAECLTPV